MKMETGLSVKKKNSKSMKEVIYFSFLSTQQENNYSRSGVKMTPPQHVYVYLLNTSVCTLPLSENFF